MTEKKIVTEIAPVLTLNSTTLVFSLSDFELILKIILLIISIIYTADRWLYYRKKNRKTTKN